MAVYFRWLSFDFEQRFTILHETSAHSVGPQASQSEDDTETESMKISGGVSCHGLTAVAGSGQAGVDAGAG